MTPLLRPSRLLAVTATLAVMMVVAGCGLLDVDNPNNLIEDELENASGAPALANGAEAAVTRALGAILSPYSTATDELTWIGSRDAWSELDRGTIDNADNEFTDNAFPYVTEARWVCDEYIGRLEGFREEGVLADENTLARTYLYGAIIYTTIPDLFDNFVIASEREEAGAPVGPENMSQLYDQALAYVTEGLKYANDDVRTALLGVRARTLFNKGIWQKVNPDVNTSSPLVQNADAVAAAKAALEEMESDYVYELVLDGSLPDLVVGDLSMAEEVNARAELGFGTDYIRPNDDGTFNAVTLADPITGQVDPELQSTITTFVAAGEYADIPIVSKREMYLILAEDALARSNVGQFTAFINTLRELDGLEAYAEQIPPRQMLIHARRVNLFLQGRRLSDHYRFGIPSGQWEGGTPNGVFLPITTTEIRANPNL